MKYSKLIEKVEDSAMREIFSYRWPGNVRELENLIERAVILEDTRTIRAINLPIFRKKEMASMDTLSIKRASEAIEKELIRKALELTKGNRTKAAELLEISFRALLYKIKGYGL